MADEAIPTNGQVETADTGGAQAVEAVTDAVFGDDALRALSAAQNAEAAPAPSESAQAPQEGAQAASSEPVDTKVEEVDGKWRVTSGKKVFEGASLEEAVGKLSKSRAELERQFHGQRQQSAADGADDPFAAFGQEEDPFAEFDLTPQEGDQLNGLLDYLVEQRMGGQQGAQPQQSTPFDVITHPVERLKTAQTVRQILEDPSADATSIREAARLAAFNLRDQGLFEHVMGTYGQIDPHGAILLRQQLEGEAAQVVQQQMVEQQQQAYAYQLQAAQQVQEAQQKAVQVYTQQYPDWQQWDPIAQQWLDRSGLRQVMATATDPRQVYGVMEAAAQYARDVHAQQQAANGGSNQQGGQAMGQHIDPQLQQLAALQQQKAENTQAVLQGAAAQGINLGPPSGVGAGVTSDLTVTTTGEAPAGAAEAIVNGLIASFNGNRR